jgi:putative spermidine/putrescine transport system permease protein
MLIDKIPKVVVTLLKLLTVALLIMPPIVVAITALSPNAFSPFPPPGLSLRWFKSFIGNLILLSGLQISILFAVIAAASSVSIATLASFAMVRYNFLGKNLLDALILSPLVFPEVALGNALLVYFYGFNYYYHPTMLILGQTIIALPYVFRVILPSFYGISQSFEEASMTLGANKIQTFFRITLPLVKPGLVAGAVLGFAAAFNDYAVSVFLVAPNTQTLPVLLMGLMRTGVDPTIAAASTFVVLIMMGLLVVVEKLVGIDKLITGMRWR